MRGTSSFSYEEKSVIFFFVCLAFFSSVFIGFRDYSVGADTYNYIAAFNRVGEGSGSFDGEPGFYIVSRIIHFFGGGVEVLFTVLAFFITLSIYLAFVRLSEVRGIGQLVLYSTCFFMLIFFSSWYFSGVTNGLRQAMALSIFYYSLVFLKDNRLFLFFVFCFLSVSFHQTMLLVMPFVFVCYFDFFNLRTSFCVFMVSAIGFYFGVNEYVVRLVSGFTGLGLYEMIKFYGVDDWGQGLWVGFDVRFFVYNTFWYLFPLALIGFNLVRFGDGLIFVLKVYSLLCVFYFVFGFGGFSNRWAYPSWLILPILQACIFYSIDINVRYKVVVSTAFFVSLVYFLNRFYYFDLA